MRIGCIHGRFQPFHNGHLSYALCALEKVDFIYVGLTKIFPTVEGFPNLRDGLHSSADESNPFSYFQRCQIVEAGLLSAGVGSGQFKIIPFTIEQPQYLPLFCPKSITCYTTIKDEWNIKKIKLLNDLGYRVEVLENVERHGFHYESGSQIRKLAQNGDLHWQEAVPKGVSVLLKDWNGRNKDVDEVLQDSV